MGKKDVREEKIATLVASYDREALLLERIAQHMKHEMELLRAGDYASLCDSLVGRGEHVDGITQIEARRRELEAELSDDRPAVGGAGSLREAFKDPRVVEARRRAAAMHRRALELDAELRELARARRAEMERELAELAQGRIASHAYREHGRAKLAPRFLDKER
ncbi:MAG: hypothetical protein NUW12_09905 [Firmicutes bacterium]|nr:hypothetical protein [Bacillota bacterium]MDH7496359.1 hypothetical protein [Bacillota bacterium]